MCFWGVKCTTAIALGSTVPAAGVAVPHGPLGGLSPAPACVPPVVVAVVAPRKLLIARSAYTLGSQERFGADENLYRSIRVFGRILAVIRRLF